jgi:hypothetical protein
MRFGRAFGVRHLKNFVIDAVAERLGAEPWSVFVELDACFERIADGGAERLSRSLY